MFNTHITAILTQIQHWKLTHYHVYNYAIYCCCILYATWIMVCFLLCHVQHVWSQWPPMLLDIALWFDIVCSFYVPLMMYVQIIMLIYYVCRIMSFITACLSIGTYMSNVYCMFTQQQSQYLLCCSNHTSVRPNHSTTWLTFALP